MMDEDRCDCPKWGVSCMAVKHTPQGVVIIVDWNCPTIQYFMAKNGEYRNLKHTLSKGGDIQ